jgi:hypothetical protein
MASSPIQVFCWEITHSRFYTGVIKWMDEGIVEAYSHPPSGDRFFWVNNSNRSPNFRNIPVILVDKDGIIRADIPIRGRRNDIEQVCNSRFLWW